MPKYLKPKNGKIKNAENETFFRARLLAIFGNFLISFEKRGPDALRDLGRFESGLPMSFLPQVVATTLVLFLGFVSEHGWEITVEVVLLQLELEQPPDREIQRH